VDQVSDSVDALKKMGSSVEGELRSLLAYYGESPESPEAPKPEDFFGLVLSFSSSLQVGIYTSHLFGMSQFFSAQKSALEVHDIEKIEASKPEIKTHQPKQQEKAVSLDYHHSAHLLVLTLLHRPFKPSKRHHHNL
jgi:diaphanous 1